MSLRRIGRGETGAAMTEYALAMIFTIPMLFYTLYLGDVFTGSMKLQDGAAAAVWYGSGILAHDYNSFNHDPKTQTAIQDGCTWVQKNWDNGLYGSGLKMLAVNGTFGNLTCQHHTDNGTNPTVSEASPLVLKGKLNYHGLVSSTMNLRMTNILVPRNTIFMHNTFDPSIDPITACAAGWPINGNCPDNVGIYTWFDDWGVEMPNEIDRNANPNGGSGSTNKEFVALVTDFYKKTGSGYGTLVLPVVLAVLGRPLLDPMDNTRIAYYDHLDHGYGVNGPAQTVHYAGPQRFNTIHWAYAYDQENGYVTLQNTWRKGQYYMGKTSVP